VTGRIDDVNTRFQRLDLVEQRNELGLREIDDAGIAITEKARIEIGQRIGKRRRLKAEIVEEGRQRVDIESPAQRHRSGGDQAAAGDFAVGLAILSHTPGSPRLSSCACAVAASIEITRLESPASAYSPMRRACGERPLPKGYAREHSM
jgi:hypothetical protein